ncbi:MAG: hypothetical protein GY928_22585 [Colwellia sp.]|nr:hypothetical protein [Colwellia sp.]
MHEYFKQYTTAQLYDLRDHISCSQEHCLSTKQQLMDEITSEMRTREVVELMKPMVKKFMEGRK